MICRRLCAGAVLLLGVLGGVVDAVAAPGTPPAIVRLDPRFDALVPPDAALERIADGFHWVEGPVWNAAGAYLLFSDIPANAVEQWIPGRGSRIYLEHSGYTGLAPFDGWEPGSNGLTFDSSGRLVLAQHGDRAIARIEPDGSRTVLAARYQKRRLNSPNDLVFKSDGSLYFTDPPFGLPRGFDDPQRELNFSGVYRLQTSGRIDLLITDVKAPNGIAFSPDESLLYVTDVDPQRPAWLVYDVLDDGRVANGRVLVDARPFTARFPGGPDGLKVDRAGNLFAAGPGGVYIFAPDGARLGMFETGTATANVAWGEDGSVLYIAASRAIYRIALSTVGAGFSS